MLGLAKTTYNQDVFFILLVMSFLLIALIKGKYWKHAKLLFKGIFAQRYANQYLREENVFTQRVNFLTFLLMGINFTMIIVKIQEAISFLEVFTAFGLVILFFLIKIISINAFGFLFKVKDLAKLAVFFSLLFDKTLGFVLSPLVLVLYFFAIDISFILLVFALFLFIILLVLKLFWLWKIGSNSFGVPQVYIFLYLCVFEIFPLLFLAKGVFY